MRRNPQVLVNYRSWQLHGHDSLHPPSSWLQVTPTLADNVCEFFIYTHHTESTFTKTKANKNYGTSFKKKNKNQRDAWICTHWKRSIDSAITNSITPPLRLVCKYSFTLAYLIDFACLLVTHRATAGGASKNTATCPTNGTPIIRTPAPVNTRSRVCNAVNTRENALGFLSVNI